MENRIRVCVMASECKNTILYRQVIHLLIGHDHNQLRSQKHDIVSHTNLRIHWK